MGRDGLGCCGCCGCGGERRGVGCSCDCRVGSGCAGGHTITLAVDITSGTAASSLTMTTFTAVPATSRASRFLWHVAANTSSAITLSISLGGFVFRDSQRVRSGSSVDSVKAVRSSAVSLSQRSDRSCSAVRVVSASVAASAGSAVNATVAASAVRATSAIVPVPTCVAGRNQ